MPFTASNTDADTSATTRLVTRGFVPPAITVLFIMPIHSSTGSGAVAETGTGLLTSRTASSINITLRIVAPAPCRHWDRNGPESYVFILRIMNPHEIRRQRCYGLANSLR